MFRLLERPVSRRCSGQLSIWESSQQPFFSCGTHHSIEPKTNDKRFLKAARNWISRYAMAVIDLPEAVAREMPIKRWGFRSMNPLNPKKLLLTKWTAVITLTSQKYFLVSKGTRAGFSRPASDAARTQGQSLKRLNGPMLVDEPRPTVFSWYSHSRTVLSCLAARMPRQVSPLHGEYIKAVGPPWWALFFEESQPSTMTVCKKTTLYKQSNPNHKSITKWRLTDF